MNLAQWTEHETKTTNRTSDEKPFQYELKSLAQNSINKSNCAYFVVDTKFAKKTRLCRTYILQKASIMSKGIKPRRT